MRVVLIGGGKVGGYLAKELREAGHGVIVIEVDAARARMVAEETSALAIHGDGSSVQVLDEVNVERADMFLAVTGSDDVNLVSCQLAKTAFGCQRVLARLNDPTNAGTFRALGVPAVSVTDLIVKQLRQEVDLKELIRIELLDQGEVALLEVEVPEDTPVRLIRELTLPPSSVLVALRRGGTVTVPNAETALGPGDRVMAVTLMSLEEDVRRAIVGKPSRRRSGGERNDHLLSIDNGEG